MTKLIYHYYRTSKIFMQMMNWKYLKCKNCGSELVLEKENEFEEMKVCPECGGKHFLIKKIRKED